MKKKIFFGLFAMVGMLLLVSCGGEISVSVYIRDLEDITQERNSVLYTTVRIVAEGLDDEEAINFLRNNLNGFSNEKMVEYNYSDSLAFDIKIPVLKKEALSQIDSTKDLLFLILEDTEDSIDVFCEYNKDLYSKLDSYIYDKEYQHIDLNKFEISFMVENESRAEKKIRTFSCYVNDKPYPAFCNVTLTDRERSEIRISKILKNAIIADNRYSIFSVSK